MLLSGAPHLWAFPFSPSLDLDVAPRTTVFYKGEGLNQKHTGTRITQTFLPLFDDAALNPSPPLVVKEVTQLFFFKVCPEDSSSVLGVINRLSQALS